MKCNKPLPSSPPSSSSSSSWSSSWSSAAAGAAAEDLMSFQSCGHLAKLTHRRDNWSCPAIRWCWGSPVTARRGGRVGRFYGWLRPYPLAELNMWHVAHLDPSKSSKWPWWDGATLVRCQEQTAIARTFNDERFEVGGMVAAGISRFSWG